MALDQRYWGGGLVDLTLEGDSGLKHWADGTILSTLPVVASSPESLPNASTDLKNWGDGLSLVEIGADVEQKRWFSGLPFGGFLSRVPVNWEAAFSADGVSSVAFDIRRAVEGAFAANGVASVSFAPRVEILGLLAVAGLSSAAFSPSVGISAAFAVAGAASVSFTLRGLLSSSVTADGSASASWSATMTVAGRPSADGVATVSWSGRGDFLARFTSNGGATVTFNGQLGGDLKPWFDGLTFMPGLAGDWNQKFWGDGLPIPQVDQNFSRDGTFLAQGQGSAAIIDATLGVVGRPSAGGTSSVAFGSSLGHLGSFRCDGRASVSFSGAQSINVGFRADGTCVVIFSAGIGAVKITCAVSQSSGSPGAPPVPLGLFDSPSSY